MTFQSGINPPSDSAINFGANQLSNVFNSFQQGQQQAQQAQLRNALANIPLVGPDGQINPQAYALMAQALAKGGDPRGALEAVRLGQEQQDVTQAQRDAAGFTGAAPTGAPGAAGAAARPAPQPVSGNTLNDMVKSVYTGSPTDAATVASNIGKALNIGPGDPVPADKRDIAQRYVQSYAERTGRQAPGLQHGAEIAQQTQIAEQKYGVSSDLLQRIVHQESGGNPASTSPKGAEGVAQFMPQTARRFGVNTRDIASSIDGEARYMKFLLDRYNGNEGLALAGYNWGEGNVDRWLAGGRGPPPETRNYVQAISGQSLMAWARGGTSGAAVAANAGRAPGASKVDASGNEIVDRSGGVPPASAALAERTRPSTAAAGSPPSAGAVTPPARAGAAPAPSGGYTVGWGGPEGVAAATPLPPQIAQGPAPRVGAASAAAAPAPNAPASAAAAPAPNAPLTPTPVPTTAVPPGAMPAAPIGATAALSPPQAPAPAAPTPAPAQAPQAPQAPAAPAQAAAPQMAQLGHRAELPVDPGTGQKYTDWEKAVDDLRRKADLVSNRAPRNPAVQRVAQNLQDKADLIEKTWSLQKLPGGDYYDPKTGKVVDPYEAAAGADMTPKALDNAAFDRIISGKYPVAGRGIIADRKRQIVENRVADMMDEAGVPAWKLPQIRQDFQTGAAGQRLLNTRAASLSLAEGEAREFIPNVEATIAKLDRTRFPDLNRVIRAAETRTGSPEEIQAAIAIRSFVTAYARVLKPTGGVIGVEDMRNAAHLLDPAWSKDQLKGAIGQFKTELANAKKGLTDAREEYAKSGRWSVPEGASRSEALRIIAGMDQPAANEPPPVAGAPAPAGGAAGAAPPDPLGIR